MSCPGISQSACGLVEKHVIGPNQLHLDAKYVPNCITLITSTYLQYLSIPFSRIQTLQHSTIKMMEMFLSKHATAPQGSWNSPPSPSDCFNVELEVLSSKRRWLFRQHRKQSLAEVEWDMGLSQVIGRFDKKPLLRTSSFLWRLSFIQTNPHRVT